MVTKRLKDYCLTFVTGILLFIAVSLLLHPDLAEVKNTWSTFYGEF